MKNVDENRTVQKPKKNNNNKQQICSHALNSLTLQFRKLLLLLIINKYDAESLKYPDLMVAQ